MFLAWMLLISGKREELAGLESKEVELPAAGADGAGAAADAAAAAEQDGNARPDHRHLADRVVQRPGQRAVRARAGAGQGVLRREADQAADGGQLPPVRRVRQWRGVAAAGGDPDHARHQPQAQGQVQGQRP
ncbi:hypothetical protein G6F60_014081 [Rhizopus arrhizus]|nr:hypothetical protein G6F60_014081 [Rhizopus arrhizus]